MKMNTDPDWLKKKAEQEDGCDVSVGPELRDMSDLTANQLLRLMDPVLTDYSAAIDEIRRRLEKPPCPDSPHGNHQCYYCGEKQAS